MGLIRRTPASRRDYADIWDYVSDHASPDIADSLLQTFDAKSLSSPTIPPLVPHALNSAPTSAVSQSAHT
jgi:hypothetical protein